MCRPPAGITVGCDHVYPAVLPVVVRGTVGGGPLFTGRPSCQSHQTHLAPLLRPARLPRAFATLVLRTVTSADHATDPHCLARNDHQACNSENSRGSTACSLRPSHHLAPCRRNVLFGTHLPARWQTSCRFPSLPKTENRAAPGKRLTRGKPFVRKSENLRVALRA